MQCSEYTGSAAAAYGIERERKGGGEEGEGRRRDRETVRDRREGRRGRGAFFKPFPANFRKNNFQKEYPER